MDIKLTNDEKQLIANSLEDCILHSIKCIKLYTEENSESELNSAKYELERFSLAKSKFLENDFYDTRTIEILLESISNRIDDLKALLFQLEKNHNYQKVIENCKYIED